MKTKIRAKKLYKTTQSLNVFRILSVNEEKFHNRLLFWLLSPEANPTLGNKFLCLFLKNLKIPDTESTKIQKISAEFQIGPFYFDERRRLDIIIETKSYYIGLENKVNRFSIDDEQLLEEYRFGIFEASNRKKKFLLVYLTPTQSIPQSIEEIMKSHADIIQLTWKNIAELIETLLKEIKQNEVYFILSQYKDYIMKEIVSKGEKEDISKVTSNILSENLFGKANARLISFLILNKENSFSIHRLSKILDLPYGTVWNNVKSLENMGLLLKQRIGKALLIQINTHHPTFIDIERLIARLSEI